MATLVVLVVLHLGLNQSVLPNLADKWARARHTPLTDVELVAAMRRDVPAIRNLSDSMLLSWLEPDFWEKESPDLREHLLGHDIVRAQRAANQAPSHHWKGTRRRARSDVDALTWLGFSLAYGVIALFAFAPPYRWARHRAQTWLSERALKRSETAFFQAERLFEAGLLSQAEIDRKRAELRQAIEDAGLGDRNA